MSANAAWSRWRDSISNLFNFRPFKPDELHGHVDAYLLALRNAVRAEVEAVLAERDEAKGSRK